MGMMFICRSDAALLSVRRLREFFLHVVAVQGAPRFENGWGVQRIVRKERVLIWLVAGGMQVLLRPIGDDDRYA